MTQNPVLNFAVAKSAIQYIGNDLQRPECIPGGTGRKPLVCGRARPRGQNLTRRKATDITQRRSGHFQGVTSEASRYLEGTLPNGLAFARNGDILISSFGTDCLSP
jgi:gluconolactonase